MMNTLPCISILQPYAWLIVNGHKDIENRGWATTHPPGLQDDIRTGWPPGMLQDDSPELSRWLAGRVGAWSLAREAAGRAKETTMELRRYSTNQLIEELARRANGHSTDKPEHWCHDCKHFVAWIDANRVGHKACPEDYNPCTKGHAMKFLAPEEIDDEYGYYLPVCADRDLMEDEGER